MADDEIGVESIYGMRSDRPLVKLTVAGHETLIPPEKARAVGQWLIEVAEASLTDAFLIRWARKWGVDTGEPPERSMRLAAGILQDFREFRRLARAAGQEQEEADQQEWDGRQPG